MTGETNVVVHVGLPKTGSTALQEDFFSRIPDCTFLTHGGLKRGGVFNALAHDMIVADDGDYPRATARAYFAEVAPRRPLLLVSHESLSGAYLKGSPGRERSFDRLQDALPQARVLLFVRNQATMVPSLYSEHLRRGGYSSFADYCRGTAPEYAFDPDRLHYDELLDACRSRFGADRVLVLAHEQLVHEREATLASILEFLRPGLSQAGLASSLGRRNRSLSSRGRTVVRHTNRLFVRSSVNPRPAVAPVPGGRKLVQAFSEVVDPLLAKAPGGVNGAAQEPALTELLVRYEASNARFEAESGLPIGTWGYPLPRR
ncbi:MAG: sulfotransferase [Actinomycetota bacterium]|jgi:hypothetical protein